MAELTESFWLIGMMGAGKTTIGKKLAKRLNCTFVDLDHEIESRTGVSISTIFEFEGETGFRQRETQALAELNKNGGQVVSTGGGVVLDPRNRALLSRSGLVVYLHAPPELLYSRTRHDRNRPLLQVENPLQRITQLVMQRDPLYREVADLVVEAGNDPGNLIGQIEAAIRKKCAN